MFNPWGYLVEKLKRLGDSLDRMASNLDSISEQIEQRTPAEPLVIEATPPPVELPAETPHTNGTAKRRAGAKR